MPTDDDFWLKLNRLLDAKFEEMERRLLDGFPDGDLVGHRRAHTEWVENEKRKAQDRRDLWKEVIKWIAVSGITTCVIALSQYLHVGPK